MAEEEQVVGVEEEVPIYFCVWSLKKLSFYKIASSESDFDGYGDPPLLLHEGHHVLPGCAAVGSTIYVCAGGCESLREPCPHMSYIDTNNLGAGLKEGPPLKEARVYPVAFSANGKLYVGGGRKTFLGNEYPRTEILDPQQNCQQWVQRVDSMKVFTSQIAYHTVYRGGEGGDRVLLWSRNGSLFSYTAESGDCVMLPLELKNPFSLAVLGDVMYTAGFQEEEFILWGYLDFTGPPIKLMLVLNSDYVMPYPNYDKYGDISSYPTIRLVEIGENELAVIFLKRMMHATQVNCIRMRIEKKILHSGNIQLVAHPWSNSQQDVASGTFLGFYPIYPGSRRQQQDSTRDLVKEVKEGRGELVEKKAQQDVKTGVGEKERASARFKLLRIIEENIELHDWVIAPSEDHV